MNKELNNNKNNDQEEYNIKLYNSVFNNIYLKRIIFNHLNIFNILLPVNIEFRSIKEWQQFKYKDYLNIVTLNYKEYDLNQLPDNIRHIVIKIPPPSESTRINEIINSIPHQIESFEFFEDLIPSYLDIINSSGSSSSNSTINSTSAISKLKSLNIDLRAQHTTTIPSSVTRLNLYGTSNLKIEKNLLPSNLKDLRYSNLKSFEDGCLPESLTNVVFGLLQDPLIINQLPLNGLVKLELDYKNDIGNDIKFPYTLQHLNIVDCRSFNATLPSGLKSFKIGMQRYEYEIQFPSTLEHVYIGFDNNILGQEVFQSRHSVPVNLKILDIQCSSIVDTNGHSILPDRLETLMLWDFDQVLKENQLPSSLTHLKCSSKFQHTIDINVLPSSLKTLELFQYTQVINPLAIPSNLQLLRIINNQYNEYTHQIKFTPSSHPNTIVDCNNLNSYYDPSNTDIRVLKLPGKFDEPLSTLRLQDKCNLNYLQLGAFFDQPIQLSDLPINNQIKTLELNFRYTHTINLEYFQNLESIIIYGGSLAYKSLNITTTTIDGYNGIYNYYKLKEIQVSTKSSKFIEQLDIQYYKFLKLIKS